MPLYPPPPPLPPMLYSDDIGISGYNNITAGVAYFSPIVLLSSTTITSMRTWINTGSPTGNIDMGIYDATGANGSPNNLLGATGANAATTGLFTKNLTANLLLSPGRYWVAFVGTVANSIGSRLGSAAGLGPYYSAGSGLAALPATAGAVSNAALRISVAAITSGGYS